MPDRELENLDDYKSFIEKLMESNQEILDGFNDDDYDNKLVWYHTGRLTAYMDCLFWLEMIGRPIPRD